MVAKQEVMLGFSVTEKINVYVCIKGLSMKKFIFSRHSLMSLIGLLKLLDKTDDVDC